MVEEARGRTSVAAFPVWSIYVLYSVLFGFVLWQENYPPAVYGGVTAFLFYLGIRFHRVDEKELPLASGVLYFAGVGAGYLLYLIRFDQKLITIGLLIFLFLLGILGNVLYFLSERQKLAYLNGQIAEEAMTLRRVERWFPLWLIVLGNILLIFAVTPLLLALLYQATGTQLFWVQEAGPFWGFFEKSFELQIRVPLKSWFGYVAGNVNQSFLGIASLVGLEFSDKSIVPTNIGKAIVFVFRVGTISLALGAVKRYLDLRSTTQRLIVALGRSAWELEQQEARHFGQKDAIEDWDVLDGRRQMWKMRLRQLLYLYPSQLDRVLSLLAGKGLWQIQLKARTKKQNLVGSARPYQGKSLPNHIRAELAELLDDPQLYAAAPGARYEVIRALLKLLESHTEEPLSAEIRQKGSLTLVRLLRSNDRPALRERIQQCIHNLAETPEASNSSRKPDAWEIMMEERAHLASTYGLIRLGQQERLVTMLSALRQSGTVLQQDAHRYIEQLGRWMPAGPAQTMNAIQRLVEQAKGADEEFLPVLDELKLALRQLSGRKDAPYRRVAAHALGLCLKEEISNPAIQQRTAETLLCCGPRFAVPVAWHLFKFSPPALRQMLLEVFNNSKLSRHLILYLREALQNGKSNKQALAALLMGQLPPTEENRQALLEKANQSDAAENTRWIALHSLAKLASPTDAQALDALQIHRDNERLWSVWKYALYRCGDANAMVDLIEVLANEPDAEGLCAAIEEILAQGRPAEGSAVCTVLDRKADKNERQSASELLVNRRSPLALLVLGHILSDSKKYPKTLRQRAAEDLGVLGRLLHVDELEALGQQRPAPEWAAPHLLYALEHDSDRLVRIRSARALGRLGLSDIRQKFEKVILDPEENAQLRQVIAQAVGELGDHTWLDFLLERYPQEKSLQVRQGMVHALNLLGADADFFLECLEQETNARLLQNVLNALAHRPSQPEARLRLLGFLDAKAKEVRSAAANALASQAVEDAIIPLTVRIQHENESEKDVRRASIKALRRLVHAYGREEEVRENLEKVFNEDPDHLVVQDTATVLAGLYGQSAGSVLLNALQQRKEREVWKKGFAGIARAIGYTRWPDAGPYLTELLQKELRSQWTHLPRLISLIRPAGLSSGENAFDMLMDLVQRNDPAFSWIAAQTIGELGDPVYIEPLTTFFEEQRAKDTLNPDLEGAILFALVRLGVMERLSELVQLCYDGSRPIARRRVLALLPDLNVDLNNVALLQAMNPQQTAHEKIRQTAVESLGKITGRIDVLLQTLRWQANSDPRAKIREAAQDAIRNITSKVQQAVYTIDDAPTQPTSSPIVLKGKSIHPVYTDVYGNTEHEERAPRRLPTPFIPAPTRKPTQAKSRTTVPTSETKESKPKAPKQPTTRKPLFEALQTNNLKKFESQIGKLLEDALIPDEEKAFFRQFQAWRQDLNSFLNTYEGWGMLPGNPSRDADAQFWPGLIQKNPVSRKEYWNFCKETTYPFPDGWHPDSKEIKRPNDPITGISWRDAAAYAEHKGWELPTHEQVVMAHSTPLLDAKGTALPWSSPLNLGEWTSTWGSRRRQLIQSYPPPHTTRATFRRDDKPDVLTFRCIRRLDCGAGSLEERIVAWQIHQFLPELVYCFAYQNSKTLPYLLAEAIRDVVRRPSLALVSADSVAVEGQPEPVKEVAKPKPVKPPKPKPTSTDKFWKRLGEGRWRKSINILKAAPKDLDPALQPLLEPLEHLLQWYESNKEMVWIHGDWKGTSEQRPFLIQQKAVSRKEYSDFCKKSGLALPRGAGSKAKKISEPQQPVEGVSLYDANQFAASKGLEVPSLLHLKRAQQAYFLDGSVMEWTTTPLRSNRRLIHCYARTSQSKRRSFRQDERRAPLAFRTVRPLRPNELPELLVTLQSQLPKGIPVEKFPTFFSEVMKETLLQHKEPPKPPLT